MGLPWPRKSTGIRGVAGRADHAEAVADHDNKGADALRPAKADKQVLRFMARSMGSSSGADSRPTEQFPTEKFDAILVFSLQTRLPDRWYICCSAT
jgi:hypothetical protein